MNTIETLRASGRTTRMALKYLLNASQNPCTPILLHDHHGTKIANECLVYQVRGLTHAMPSPLSWEITKSKDGAFWLTFIPKAIPQ